MVPDPLNREVKTSFVRIGGNGVAPSAGVALVDFSRVSSLVNSVGFFLTPNNTSPLYRVDDGLRNTGSSSATNLAEKRNDHLTPEVTEKSKDNKDVKESSAAPRKRVRTTETVRDREDASLQEENEDFPGGKRRKTNGPAPQVNKEEGEGDSRAVDPESTTDAPAIEVQGLQCHAPSILVPGDTTVTLSMSPGVAKIFFVQAGQSNVIGDKTLTMTSPAADHYLQREIESLRKNQVILKQRISRFQEVFKNKVLLEAVLKKLYL